MKALDARERQNWVNVLRIVSQIECENTDNTETKMSLVKLKSTNIYTSKQV